MQIVKSLIEYPRMHLTYFIRSGTHVIFCILDLNGDATKSLE